MHATFSPKKPAAYLYTTTLQTLPVVNHPPRQSWAYVTPDCMRWRQPPQQTDGVLYSLSSAVNCQNFTGWPQVLLQGAEGALLPLGCLDWPQQLLLQEVLP